MALQIIGAGFPRTGTMSLKMALQELGFRDTYHYKDLIAEPERLTFWKEIENTGQTDFDQLFAGFQATIDFPGFSYYKQLLNQYPHAKVVLSVRPFEDWYDSTLTTIWERKIRADRENLTNDLTTKKVINPCVQFMRDTYLTKMFAGQFADKKMAEKVYYQHHAEVVSSVPKEQLLVFEVKEGWQPLCDFLKIPCPTTDFPHLNKKEDFHAMVDRMLAKKLAAA